MKKIMVVDDEVDLCDMIAETLTRTGKYEVRVITDPERVVVSCEIYRPDLLLLDIVMPRLKGTELIEILKEKSMLSHMIVILTSGLGEIVYNKLKDSWSWQPNYSPDIAQESRNLVVDKRDAQKVARAYGVDDYLVKPFSPRQLRDILEKNLSSGKTKA